MTKTLRIWLALVAVGIVAALFFGRSRVETKATNRPWPLGLGGVADAPKHFPVTKDNGAASKLIKLAKEAETDLRVRRDYRSGVSYELRDSFLDFLRAQLERSGDAIDAPPSDVAHYLSGNAAPLDEIRQLALSGQPIVFESDISKGPHTIGPNIPGLQHLHRAFVARALDLARTRNAGAWDELHAAWELVRPLWGRPDPEAIVAASTSARMIDGAARKMPLPPPAWFREVDSFAYERSLAAALQAESWRSRIAANDVRLRSMTEEVLRARACDYESPQFDAVREKLGARATPSLLAMWERMMRFRAEREATQRVLQIRSGQAPSPQSQCSDGSWKATQASFEFTRQAPVRQPQIHYPLRYSRAR